MAVNYDFFPGAPPMSIGRMLLVTARVILSKHLSIQRPYGPKEEPSAGPIYIVVPGKVYHYR